MRYREIQILKLKMLVKNNFLFAISLLFISCVSNKIDYGYCSKKIDLTNTIAVEVISKFDKQINFSDNEFFRNGNKYIINQKINLIKSDKIVKTIELPNIIQKNNFQKYVYTEISICKIDNLKYISLYAYTLSNSNQEINIFYDENLNECYFYSNDTFRNNNLKMSEIIDSLKIEKKFEVFPCN